MHDELTAWDLRYNIMALTLCFYKRGHPNVVYENNEEIFEEEYSIFEKDYYSPDEIINIFKNYF